MISEQKKFIFIHVAKTGGNSMQNILSKYSDDEITFDQDPMQDGIELFNVINKKYGTWKHSTLQKYQEVLGDKFKDYFTFCTIRNPWERVISFYFSPILRNEEFIKEKFISIFDLIPTLSECIKLKETGNLQTHLQNIDFLLKFENLEEDFKLLCQKIGIEYEPLPHRNKSERNHYSFYYDDSIMEMVNKKFEEEIDFFGYEFSTNENTNI